MPKIERKASVKLEDSYSSLTINSLKIIVNDLEIEDYEKVGDEYVFYFEILPNEGKKIEISYKTDSNLQNARIIKYSMDKIEGKEVKIFQIDIKLSKYDIPLVQKIWPGAYDFYNETISTEYVDFKVNNLTSNIIIEKETYKNLKYGEYAETRSETEQYILNHAKELIDNGIPNIEYTNTKYKINDYSEKKILKDLTGVESDRDNGYRGGAIGSIFRYVLIQQLKKDGKEYTNYSLTPYGEEISGNNEINMYINGYCLTLRKIGELCDEGIILGNEATTIYTFNVNKKVAINYYETEEGKELYVKKNINNNKDNIYDWIIRDEYSILRTIDDEDVTLNYQEVYVNSDIDGNKIDITEEEILDFVNMMNIDLYIRKVIHDVPGVQADKPSGERLVRAAYYTDDAKEIASKYVKEEKIIEGYKYLIEHLEEEYENISYHSVYNDKESWIKKKKEMYEEYIEEVKCYYTKFENEVVENNSRVPTLAQCVANCTREDGKYRIGFCQTTMLDIISACECDTAKRMLEENKSYNDSKRNEIATKISNTKITSDEQEYKANGEIATNENNNLESVNTNIINTENNIIDNIIKNPIILGMIVFILVLIIILIFIIIRGIKNGTKEKN